MGILDELQEEMKLLDKAAEHDGYWYSASGVMTILVCGMLCGLRLIDDIDDWAKAAPTKAFLQALTRTPCRAQFYNILKCVDAGKFNLGFSRWMATVLGGPPTGKTIAIDGKTVRGKVRITWSGAV